MEIKDKAVINGIGNNNNNKIVKKIYSKARSLQRPMN